MYDFNWHGAHGAKTSASARIVVSQLLRMLNISSVLDVGCGDGRWLQAFKDAGVASVLPAASVARTLNVCEPLLSPV